MPLAVLVPHIDFLPLRNLTLQHITISSVVCRSAKMKVEDPFDEGSGYWSCGEER